MSRHTFTGTVRVPLTRSVRTEHPSGSVSWHGEKYGTRTATINLQIDVDRLIAWLGSKAALSKGRKSKLQGGLITATVIDSTDEERTT